MGAPCCWDVPKGQVRLANFGPFPRAVLLGMGAGGGISHARLVLKLHALRPIKQALALMGAPNGIRSIGRRNAGCVCS